MIYPTIPDLKQSIDERIFTNNTYAVTALGINDSFKDTIDTLMAMFASMVGVAYKFVAVIDPNGSDVTGALGAATPFATLAGANAALTAAGAGFYNSLVIINPGCNLTPDTNSFRDWTNYYFHRGTTVTCEEQVVKGKFDSAIYGYGTFISQTTQVFLFDNPSQYAQGIIEFSYINAQTAGQHSIEIYDGGDIDILFKGNTGATTGSSPKGYVQNVGNVIYIVNTNPAKNVVVRFENVHISSTSGGSAVFGNITATANSYVMFRNSLIEQADNITISNTVQFQAGSCPLVIYNSRIVGSSAATYSVVCPTLYYDNNVLANLPTNNTSDIGPGTTIQVDVAYDKIFT